MKEIIRAQKAPVPTTGPYSQACKVGNTLYIAGTCGQKPITWELAGEAEGDIKAEVKQLMENIKAIVEEAGGTMDSIVSVQVFFTDETLMPAFNEVYRSYFTEGQMPARIAVKAGGGFLGTTAHFELNATAVIE